MIATTRIPRNAQAQSDEFESLYAELHQLGRRFDELWPSVEDYFFQQKKKNPQLMRPLLEKEKERQRKFNNMPCSHEQTLEHMRGLTALMRHNLDFVQRLKEEMEDTAEE